jgi:hypothetical protein
VQAAASASFLFICFKINHFFKCKEKIYKKNNQVCCSSTTSKTQRQSQAFIKLGLAVVMCKQQLTHFFFQFSKKKEV